MTTTPTLWAIASTHTNDSGDESTTYWTRGGFSLGGPTFGPLEPPNGLTGTVLTFPTKAAAKACYRKHFGTFRRDLGAVALTAEQLAATKDATDAPIVPQEAVQGATAEAAVAAVPAVTGDVVSKAPGGLTEKSTGQTDRVAAIVAKATAATEDTTGDVLCNQAVADDIDQRLRAEAQNVAQSMERFKDLIDEARSRNIHAMLGFKSWTAYIADVIGSEMTALTVDDRRQVVALLSGEGMSTRAQAEALGVSNATISRDQQVLHDVTPDSVPTTVTGLDDKTYTRPAPAAEPKPKPEPTPATPPAASFHNLMTRLETLTKVADEALDIANELTFDADARHNGVVYEGSDQYDAAEALAENLKDVAESILETIQGNQ